MEVVLLTWGLLLLAIGVSAGFVTFIVADGKRSMGPPGPQGEKGDRGDACDCKCR